MRYHLFPVIDTLLRELIYEAARRARAWDSRAYPIGELSPAAQEILQGICGATRKK